MLSMYVVMLLMNPGLLTFDVSNLRYVWNQEASEWVPTLVILRLNRAALCVQWSPKGSRTRWQMHVLLFILLSVND